MSGHPEPRTEPAGKVYLAVIRLQTWVLSYRSHTWIEASSYGNQVKWDYEIFNPLIAPKQKTWTDQARQHGPRRINNTPAMWEALFNLQKNHIWGHERLMLLAEDCTDIRQF